MNTRPAHEAQHQGEGRHYREHQRQPHRPTTYRGQSFVGRDAGWKPYQWEERIDGPNQAALRAGREKSWQDRCSRTIKDIRVTEARGEVSEDDKETQSHHLRDRNPQIG